MFGSIFTFSIQIEKLLCLLGWHNTYEVKAFFFNFFLKIYFMGISVLPAYRNV